MSGVETDALVAEDALVVEYIPAEDEVGSRPGDDDDDDVPLEVPDDVVLDVELDVVAIFYPAAARARLTAVDRQIFFFLGIVFFLNKKKIIIAHLFYFFVFSVFNLQQTPRQSVDSSLLSARESRERP